jgi:bifunctional UDP-N-acetylglucosamine pyrophosphorylase/glucosamine-1-phosphate N-acetyltransferase
MISNGSEILGHSYLEEAIVHEKAIIGPMARLRPGADVGAESKIGNFVEVKKSKLSKGVKISHLSYVGDAEIGENTNIGCGFITCNYDGVNKHKTKIGSNSFIGSDCQMVAPIEIGNDAFVAAGSTITKNVPDGGFGIARAQQVVKDGAAKRFLKRKKS